ncbi:MAG: hypothetical protein RTU92_01750, partial [Candidatus Thorarchaeota archaeon]
MSKVQLSAFRTAIEQRRFDQLRLLLQDTIESSGWIFARDELRTALNTSVGDRWFLKNDIFLHIFGAEELIGYDGDVDQILGDIDLQEHYDAIRIVFHDRLVNLVKAQLLNGGSTLFFNSELMSERISASLIPILIEARQREIVTALSRHKSDKYRHENYSLPIWKTSYGFSILCRRQKEHKRGFETSREINSDIEKMKDEYLSHETIDENEKHLNLSARLSALVESLACIHLREHHKDSIGEVIESGFLHWEDFIDITESASEESWSIIYEGNLIVLNQDSLFHYYSEFHPLIVESVISSHHHNKVQWLLRLLNGVWQDGLEYHYSMDTEGLLIKNLASSASPEVYEKFKSILFGLSWERELGESFGEYRSGPDMCSIDAFDILLEVVGKQDPEGVAEFLEKKFLECIDWGVNSWLGD